MYPAVALVSKLAGLPDIGKVKVPLKAGDKKLCTKI